jgi:hypothetical protein
MKHTLVSVTVVSTYAFLLCGCDKGLAPLNEPSGFSGVIRFQNWPPQDSVLDLRVVAFKQYPTDSSGILVELLAGRAVVYPAVTGPGFPRFVDSVQYEFTTDGSPLQITKYDYVVVAWRYGPNFFSDWRPAGVYTTQPNTFIHAPVRVLLHKILQDINIQCDFRNPPPRPWR